MPSNRSRLAADQYWYLSPSADAAIDKAIAADPKRSWDPRADRPSLASLEGKAKRYAARYRWSRTKLLARAGVRVRGVYEREAGRRVWIVTMPGEPLRAAVRLNRRERRIEGAS